MSNIMNKLRPITVLLTSAGCPGASTCIRYLKGIKERDVRVVGTDASIENIGKYLSDDFCQVPLASDSGYIDVLFDYAVKQNVDAILVSSSYEVEVIAAQKERFENVGIKVLTSSSKELQVANNKRFLYEMFNENPIVKVPEFKVVKTLNQFIESCEEMGYPKQDLCFKPPYSKGSRGFRYMAADISRADLLLNHKPDNKVISLDEMIEIFSKEKEFPELLLMETVSGEEIDSMVLASSGEPLLITHKSREQERGGVITLGGHCLNSTLDEAIAEILKKIPLSYNIGVQFKGGYLMEINPRLSTFMYTQEWVEPYFAIKFALGEYSKQDVIKLKESQPVNLRMFRYFDQYFFE